jgi:zinc transport system ATP-binding protein
MEPVVEARGLSVRRDGLVLLDAVDLDVGRGSVHAIIGPNGAGKSTTVAAVLGHTSFTGRVTMRLSDAGVVGYVPQSFTVDRTLPLTVLDFLALTRQRRPVCLGVARAVAERCGALLERVGLAGFASRPLGALSGGELRRVLLANALDPRPELLVLDEPSTGLDRAGVTLLERLLVELRDEHGATVLMVSHDASQVRRLADAVSWIDRSVRRRGTVDEVFGGDPVFPFAREEQGFDEASRD